MKLLVGLGNPGSRYARTKHNAGFLILDQLAEKHGISLSQARFDSHFGEGSIFDERVVLVKPTTFVNLSGSSVGQWVRYYKVVPEDLIIIYDDIDMPEGKVKTRQGGGHGGHNGVRSILDSLGQSEFYRIKLGIGKPEIKTDKEREIHDWVLSPFTVEQMETLKGEMFDDVMLRLRDIFIKNKPIHSKGDARA